MHTQAQAQLFGQDCPEWGSLLERVPHDIYHTPQYHSIPGFGRRGDAYVFSYCEGDKTFLWPYLLAPVQDGLYDVTSVYGYCGPVSSPGAEFIERAWASLQDHWRMQSAVSAFTRFHPLLDNGQLLATLPQACEGIRPTGKTVSIDLSVSLEEQLRHYQKVLRQQIRKSREIGFTVEEDTQWTCSEDFISVYGETMARRNSRSEYQIDATWLKGFREYLGSSARLFVTRHEGRVAAVLLAMVYPPYIHAHLTGINPELASLSPLKVLLDGIREWATLHGLKSFHLGGGLGGREDSLFEFKRKFSQLTNPFQTGAWIIQPEAYALLEAEHKHKLQLEGFNMENSNFFPSYRYQPL